MGFRLPGRERLALAIWEDEEEAEELRRLVQLKEDVDSEEWPYGVALIRDSYFEDFARDEAENSCIDWKAAADELKVDYRTVTFEGVTYWFRY